MACQLSLCFAQFHTRRYEWSLDGDECSQHRHFPSTRVYHLDQALGTCTLFSLEATVHQRRALAQAPLVQAYQQFWVEPCKVCMALASALPHRMVQVKTQANMNMFLFVYQRPLREPLELLVKVIRLQVSAAYLTRLNYQLRLHPHLRRGLERIQAPIVD